jgi:hypothetical protein
VANRPHSFSLLVPRSLPHMRPHLARDQAQYRQQCPRHIRRSPSHARQSLLICMSAHCER